VSTLDRDQLDQVHLVEGPQGALHPLLAAERRVLARLLDAERVLDRVATMLGQLRDEVSDTIDALTSTATTTKGTP
jgi:hypothetical protein